MLDGINHSFDEKEVLQFKILNRNSESGSFDSKSKLNITARWINK